VDVAVFSLVDVFSSEQAIKSSAINL